MRTNLDGDNSEYAYGYWTSSPYSGDSRYAWNVNYDGTLYDGYLGDVDIFGVRSVITISKSNLSL